MVAVGHRPSSNEPSSPRVAVTHTTRLPSRTACAIRPAVRYVSSSGWAHTPRTVPSDGSGCAAIRGTIAAAPRPGNPPARPGSGDRMAGVGEPAMSRRIQRLLHLGAPVFSFFELTRQRVERAGG